MKPTRQITLQDRLSVMISVLPGAVAAVMVFSLVLFSPLIDMKDSISAAAQSHGERGGGGGKDRSDRSDRNDKSDRGDKSDRSDKNDRNDKSDRGDKNDRNDKSDRNERSSRSDRDRDSDRSASSQSKSETRAPDSDDSTANSPANSASNNDSGNSAQEKPGSGSLLQRLFGGRQFSGDSEPSGKPLSRGQEQEAIQNGWK